jgi:hypothetical protein
MKEQYDNEAIYCRKLGHHLQFQYCRQEKSGLPCTKIFDCWFDRIAVKDFITLNYTREEVAYLSAPPENKMVSLMTLIERARNNA